MASLSYLKLWNGFYQLFTVDRGVVRKLNYVRFHYNTRRRHFEATVQYLPEVKGLEEVVLKPAKVKPPTEEVHHKVEELYASITVARDALEQQQKLLAKQEEKLEKLVKKHGLHLRPGVIEDSQLLLRDVGIRLHLQLALSRSYDQEAIERYADKYPELKECLKEVTKVVVDRFMVEEVLPTLPTQVANSVVKLQPVERLAETPLKKPGCRYCGGVLRKTGECSRCGLKP